ncbi:hypothetical protein [uncultured Gammaproteobacteria bacterium]|nr:hypothetical protein [uncultured Gammaproteobacteria bacterium]
MIKKPFTKLNSMVQSRLRLLAEKFSTSTVNVIFYKFVRLTKHKKKIQGLQKKYNKFKKTPVTRIRASGVVLFSVLSIALLWLIYKNPYEWEILKQITIDTKSIISLTTLIITAPIVFVVWLFRDKNKLLELENARKDTNLKEFQQLQRWATGNIDSNSDNDNKIALQISALYSLCAYLKGEYGESFRRGAYEIFRAILATQHQKILQQLKNDESKTIRSVIDSCPLTKQLNIIASEEWFNLLINHNFPTKGISLVGVDLSHTYLHHRTYGETLTLQGAQLQGANLWGARLQGANLWDARLQGANLGGARLQGADLWGVRLQGAYVETGKLLNFQQKITQQINKETESQNLKNHYRTLNDVGKSQLIAELKAINSVGAVEAISRIQSASKTLDLSQAITGKYSQEEANEWLNDYKEARYYGF